MRTINKQQAEFLKINRYIKLNPAQKQRVTLEFKRIMEDNKIFDEMAIKIKKAGRPNGKNNKQYATEDFLGNL